MQVYIWAQVYHEEWSAFAPDFKVGSLSAAWITGTDLIHIYMYIYISLKFIQFIFLFNKYNIFNRLNLFIHV